ncbi:MAG: Rpn family recombination-promoting nuclease/putative transposase [Methyloprofundus sp.]|nr:Rpn family recombination-promoting nuclease/putative transposase [Methyloprofundus sp.]
MKFLDVKTDYAFKKVFGSEQSHDILISFLNAVIRFNDDLKIKSLEIVDPYNIPMIKGMKDSFVDVKARLEDDSLVIIEMQVLNHQGFEKRVLYNAAKNYSVQLNQSDDYHLLNPVIALNIVDFNMFEDSDKVISNFKLIEKEEFIHYSDDIELIFIELPKFNKTLDELQSLQDKWIYFIQNAGHLQFIPEHIEQEIKRALDIANEANLSAEELELQHKRKEFIFIQKSSIELASERAHEQGLEAGIEQGIEQGLKQGIETAMKKVVINSHRSGMSIQSIADITGLSEIDIKSIIRT